MCQFKSSFLNQIWIKFFKVRVSEHMGVSALTGNYIKSNSNSAVRDHMLVCNNSVCLLKTVLFWLMEPMIFE